MEIDGLWKQMVYEDKWSMEIDGLWKQLVYKESDQLR